MNLTKQFYYIENPEKIRKKQFKRMLNKLNKGFPSTAEELNGSAK